MRTNGLKLLVLLLIGIALAACARQKPLELPPPLIGDEAGSGWHNY